MRVAILGAGGTIAPAIVRDLAESDEVDELLLVDLDADKARATAERHGGGKASVADGVAGADVVVNSAGYRINLDAMRSSLEAGAHYVDLGGLYWMTGKQLELARGLRARGTDRDPRHGLEPRQDERDGGARRSRRSAPRSSIPSTSPRAAATSTRPTARASRTRSRR